jgi:hypothetical protein
MTRTPGNSAESRAAARLASSVSSNSANVAGPLPDISAALAPSLCSVSRMSPMTGWRATTAGRRSLRTRGAIWSSELIGSGQGGAILASVLAVAPSDWSSSHHWYASRLETPKGRHRDEHWMAEATSHRLKQIAAPSSPGRPAGKAKRNVGPQTSGDWRELEPGLRRLQLPLAGQQVVKRLKGGRGIGAAPAQSSGDGYPFVDSNPDRWIWQAAQARGGRICPEVCLGRPVGQVGGPAEMPFRTAVNLDLKRRGRFAEHRPRPSVCRRVLRCGGA